MLFSTIGQGYVFLWMMAAGMAVGAWYGLLAALRRLLQAGFWIMLAADLAFGAGAAALFLAALVIANYGQARFFAVFGALLGFALFVFGLYPPLRRLVRGLSNGICRMFIRIGQYRWIKVIFR